VGSDTLVGAIGAIIYWTTTGLQGAIHSNCIHVGTGIDTDSTGIIRGVLDNYVQDVLTWCPDDGCGGDDTSRHSTAESMEDEGKPGP
jgi:hypothetical protein